MLTECERLLGQGLQALPAKYNYRYGPAAQEELLRLLFLSLAGNDPERLRLLFPSGPPEKGPWKLAEAQGAEEGAEYTEAARGKRCGHIFRPGEGTYRCMTCATDETCVLCSRCFDASDHTGHQYQISLSSGNCGCCDCGDEEAWRIPLCCAIHTDNEQLKGKKREAQLPDEWVADIRATIARAMDYFCDVISCSPEQLRLPKTEEGIRHDEVASRLQPGFYGDGDEPDDDPEFALCLWNDEKHTITDVAHQVTRACRERDSFGQAKAHETNDIGRSVVKYSKDLPRLLQVSKIIEQIKVTMTIRSSRDTFREDMCGTIIEWLADIAGCSFGDDHQILRHVICEEFLRPWRIGSKAYNADIGLKGIDDHERHDATPLRAITLTVSAQGQVIMNSDDDEEDDDPDAVANGQGQDDEEDDVEEYNDASQNAREAEDAEFEPMEVDLERLGGGEGDGNNEMEIDNRPAAGAETRTTGSVSPPPPNGGDTAGRQETPGESAPYPWESHIKIPRTPTVSVKPTPAKTPSHWLVRPSPPIQGDIPPYEDLSQRTRLDWMILFDLRLWKKTRKDLRDLYISTVVNVPQFKRIMGLRLSALYTALAQLYLIADREPDHSIVNLSFQLLTTPSITEEILDRGNFLTKVMAILYTFLTTRQVGEPWEVNPTATLAFDAGSVTNRRLYHFFFDLRHLLQSKYVRDSIRTEEQYLLQFLDLVKLPQGICPNVRAVGEHVEYETDAWISASILMREINRLCRQFCESFRHPEVDSGANLMRAINAATIAAVVHSTGLERKRFDQAEIRDYVSMKYLPPFTFEISPDGQPVRRRVVNFVVDKGSMSFHHPLQYTLSWLIECGRGMDRELMRSLLLRAARIANEKYVHDRHLSDEDLLLVMFDYPLRVCAWLAQMKAGMWVRNGLSLRHQMSQYRGVSSRDFAFYRDIFMLQTALVTCDPSRVLASIADRFGVISWANNNYQPPPGYDHEQIIDVAEEFVHLLIILVADRTSLTAIDDDLDLIRETTRREIAHVLCFRPLSFSDLSNRLSDRLLETDVFQDVLEEVATFRPPEGLNDTGTFELKPEYIDLVDPYSAHYSKNQRDEAESIYRSWLARKTGKKESDIVFEPKLRPITNGMFTALSEFMTTPVFTQIVHHCLDYVTSPKGEPPSITATRVESFLQIVLHLIVLAVLEDRTSEGDAEDRSRVSFVHHALTKSKSTQVGEDLTIVGLLQKVSVISEFESCGPKIKHILRLMWRQRPQASAAATQNLKFPYERLDAESPETATTGESERDLKKKQALDRQARVMAQFQQQQQNFLNAQGGFDWGEEDFSDEELEAPAETESKIWKYPSGTCILCQEETNDSRLYGTFALVQDSGILRQTDVTDRDWIREVLKTPSSLDRSCDHLRPFGVAGENRMTVRKLDSTGGEVLTQKIGLSKGFPSKSTVRGPVTTGCGHIMHYTCFEAYYAATHRRQAQQVARNHPEQLSLKEFVCPLCKALGNAFLPIIWKGKEESFPGVLEIGEPFDEFVGSYGGAWDAVPNWSMFDHKEGGKAADEVDDLYRSIFLDYLRKSLVTPLSTRIEQLTVSVPPSPPQSLGPSTRIPLPGFFPSAEDIAANSPVQAPPPAETPVSELMQIYRRLKATLLANRVQTQFSTASEELDRVDSLIRSFGFSISALEISQRGVESEPGATLLDKIPQLALTHLRVLAESALSYAAVGAICARNNRVVRNFQEMHRDKITQLFAGHPVVTSSSSLMDRIYSIEPLLQMDTFVFLAECSIALPLFINIEIGHLVRLCYVAEIVKVVATLPQWRDTLQEELDQHGNDEACDAETDARYSVTRRFVDLVLAEVKANSPSGTLAGLTELMEKMDTPPTAAQVMALRRMIEKYALTFLRKTVILLHVQHGVDFPTSGLGEEHTSELDRLTRVLRLPTLDEVFASFSPPAEDPEKDSGWNKIIHGWIWHWNVTRNDRRLWPSLPHPAIFELVGLPEHYDMLIDEASRRRCPVTKKELTDPSICLFCGDIFCSQAVCCMGRGKLGGCNQHMLKCGKNIGLFINIRKCTVLYLHNHNGSWQFAPYLDRHGEVDPGLRRNRQLVLNQKRYDKLLRDVWLTHSIPATISRKLEADINNGGWETI
ncbi:hypothetical protein VTN31DRAFT_75 [Thermomyces dupontii]|uniref:uncharacterized protein n=1 Tax=Talaromyces thermophilus TaxID=28565 RepID=UPI0037443EEA